MHAPYSLSAVLGGPFLLWCLGGCAGTPDSGLGGEAVLPACGNGVVEPDEPCDDGAANSDTQADACRTTCRLPTCGDAVADADEDCDDGNPWGGDGCDPTCLSEAGPFEAEPNDTWDTAQSISLDTDLYGALPAGDVDCYTVPVARCDALRATMDGDCGTPAVLGLYSSEGAQVAAGGEGGAGGCPVLEPADEPGARFLAAGDWVVCAAPLLEGVLPAYTLHLTTVDSGTLGVGLDDLDDLDGDGDINDCDEDIDGDGYANEADNCPEVANGADVLPLSPDGDGFLRHWLTVGPFTGNSSPSGCLPSDLDLTGIEDGEVSPVVGDAAGELVWRVQVSPEGRVDFLNYSDVGAPREVYAVTYLYNATPREVVLGLGPDDGARAWLDGVSLLEISGCQGTVVDQFTASVELSKGWHRLTLKVYDQGGGWGTYARFLTPEGVPITDLEVSLTPDAPWSSDQTDLDGDGVGDVCDETPAGG